MAVSRVKTWSAGEILTASDLNAEFNNLINNGTSMAFPLTANASAGSFKITTLAAATADGDAVRFQQLPFSVCDFRLTLTTATPVTTADVTAAETLYMSPYTGNAIGLYDGTNWHVRTTAEISIDVPDATGVYDVFCYDNAGTPTLEVGAWTNDTTRTNAISQFNGVLVRGSGTNTRRYLGSFYCTTAGNGQIEDSVANRYLWNYYNRVPRPMRVLEATATWDYTTATIRQARATATNQIAFVIGVSEDMVSAEILAQATNTTNVGVSFVVGVGLDSTSTFASEGLFLLGSNYATAEICIANARWNGYPGVGKHFLSWNEYSEATGTTRWQGVSASPPLQSGIYGVILG